MNIKNIILILLTLICIFFIWKSSNNRENINKESLINSDIKRLQNKSDSLEKISNQLAIENIKYQESYKKDSILIDSLTNEYNSLSDETDKLDEKATNYLNKYNNLTKGINSLQNNKNYRIGDSLLRSLGEKI